MNRYKTTQSTTAFSFPFYFFDSFCVETCTFPGMSKVKVWAIFLLLIALQGEAMKLTIAWHASYICIFVLLSTIHAVNAVRKLKAADTLAKGT